MSFWYAGQLLAGYVWKGAASIRKESWTALSVQVRSSFDSKQYNIPIFKDDKSQQSESTKWIVKITLLL